MYTQKIANIFDHIQDHSRLGLKNKFLENKSRQIFLRLTGLLYKFLPTNQSKNGKFLSHDKLAQSILKCKFPSVHKLPRI